MDKFIPGSFTTSRTQSTFPFRTACIRGVTPFLFLLFTFLILGSLPRLATAKGLLMKHASWSAVSPLLSAQLRSVCGCSNSSSTMAFCFMITASANGVLEWYSSAFSLGSCPSISACFASSTLPFRQYWTNTLFFFNRAFFIILTISAFLSITLGSFSSQASQTISSRVLPWGLILCRSTPGIFTNSLTQSTSPIRTAPIKGVWPSLFLLFNVLILGSLTSFFTAQRFPE